MPRRPVNLSNVPTIGLDGEQRNDHALRDAFVGIFDAASPFMDNDGNWLSNIHEVQAYDALTAKFPDLTGMRQFAVLARIANVKASGRRPA